MKTLNDWVNKLYGWEYGENFPASWVKEWEETGIVVVYGYSDDLIEFEGALSEEFGSDEVRFTKEGFIENECDDYDCPHYKRMLKEAPYYVVPNFAPGHPKNPTWTYSTNVPHQTFTMMEDDDVYCYGLIFNINDLV